MSAPRRPPLASVGIGVLAAAAVMAASIPGALKVVFTVNMYTHPSDIWGRATLAEMIGALALFLPLWVAFVSLAGSVTCIGCDTGFARVLAAAYVSHLVGAAVMVTGWAVLNVHPIGFVGPFVAFWVIGAVGTCVLGSGRCFRDTAPILVAGLGAWIVGEMALRSEGPGLALLALFAGSASTIWIAAASVAGASAETQPVAAPPRG